MNLVNGSPAELLPLTDRGLLYGDGLFETLAIRAGHALAWPQHMARLQQGCQRLGIPSPDTGLLQTEMQQLCRQADTAVLKIIITRGSGGRGYLPPADGHPSRILSLHPWPDYPARLAHDGIRARICGHRLPDNPDLAGIKHLNRLDQVLARAEWDDPGIREGLMLDARGHVIEGTMSNVFVIESGRLLTPSLEQAGVAGILRAEILAWAREQQFPHEVSSLPLVRLEGAECVFVCNSLIGIWPVQGLQTPAGEWSWDASANLPTKLTDHLRDRGILP